MIFFLFSFICGMFGAWFIMKYGERIGINDVPNDRSSHEKVVPKGGGIGILSALIMACLVLSIPFFLLVPAVIISLVSFWGGDKHRLSVKERLFFQFGCSLFFLIFFLHSKQADNIVYLLCLPLSVFITGTSNFYNFMDGIDGIAGITGVMGFSLLSLYGYVVGADDVYLLLCISLAFSCLGFLCFNAPKAKVFLGDVGSILVGFLFACLMIILSKSLIDFVVMVGFLAPFYYDELITMVVRICDGDSLSTPHRKHIYQVLANEGAVSHWKVSLAYSFVQMVIGFSVILIKQKGLNYILMAHIIYIFLFIMVSIGIRRKVVVK